MRSTSLSCMRVGARTRVPLTYVPFAESRSVTSTPSLRRRTHTWFRETKSSVLNGGPSRSSRPSTTPLNAIGICRARPVLDMTTRLGPGLNGATLAPHRRGGTPPARALSPGKSQAATRKYNSALQLDGAADAGDRAAADPHLAVGVARDVDPAVAAHRRALAGHVRRGDPA